MGLLFVARVRRAVAPAAGWRCVLLALTVACGDGRGDPPPVAPQPGALDVAVDGLPAGAAPSVSVTGPGNFSRTLTAPQRLEQLAAGTYVVAAAPVTAGASVYRATLTSSHAPCPTSAT